MVRTKVAKKNKKKKTGKGTLQKKPAKGREILKRAASKASIKGDENEEEDEPRPKRVVPAPKKTAKGKANAKAKADAKKANPKMTAAKSKAAPKTRLRRKASVVADSDLYEEIVYKQFEDYLGNFELCDAGDQFKRLTTYYINFNKLNSVMTPYWTRESCLVKTKKEVTADGKEMTWSFSFTGADGKGGIYWVWELACSICAAHCMVPRYEKNVVLLLNHSSFLCDFSFHLDFGQSSA